VRRNAPLKPGSVAAKAHAALVRAIDAKGQHIPGITIGTKAVHVDDWRAEFLGTKNVVPGNSAAKAFRRGRDTLGTLGKVQIAQDFAWLSVGDN
jgi:hypothetical protein